MPSTLRKRLSLGAAAALVAGLLCNVLTGYLTFGSQSMMGDGTIEQLATPYTWVSLLSGVGGFCIAVAVALVVGVVASFVIEEALERRLWMDADLDDDDRDDDDRDD